MTEREEIIALREDADKFATNKLSCEGEYHPDFHTISDEHFYVIAQASRDVEVAKLREQVTLLRDVIKNHCAPYLGHKEYYDEALATTEPKP